MQLYFFRLCSCLTFVLPLVLFTHIWNPALMNPIATVGDRVTIMFVFLNVCSPIRPVTFSVLHKLLGHTITSQPALLQKIYPLFVL